MSYNSLPKYIWIFWGQGWSQAPLVVQKCRESWINQNPDYHIKSLDLTSFDDPELFTPAEKQNMTTHLSTFKTTDTGLMTNKSWYLRAFLLQKLGGIWVDATVYCRIPLKKWLPEMLSDNHFFIFQWKTFSRNTLLFDKPLDYISTLPTWDNTSIRYKGGNISSWFMVADKNSYLASKFFEATVALLDLKPTKLPYFAAHYLFPYNYYNDTKYKELYDKLVIKNDTYTSEACHNVREGKPLGDIPVQKLQWKNGWNNKDILEKQHHVMNMFNENKIH